MPVLVTVRCFGCFYEPPMRREEKGNWQRNTLEWEKGEGEVRKTKQVTRSFNHPISQHQQISSPAYAADDLRRRRKLKSVPVALRDEKRSSWKISISEGFLAWRLLKRKFTAIKSRKKSVKFQTLCWQQSANNQRQSISNPSKEVTTCRTSRWRRRLKKVL